MEMFKAGLTQASLRVVSEANQRYTRMHAFTSSIARIHTHEDPPFLRPNLVYVQRAEIHNERPVDNETDIISSSDD